MSKPHRHRRTRESLAGVSTRPKYSLKGLFGEELARDFVKGPGGYGYYRLLYGQFDIHSNDAGNALTFTIGGMEICRIDCDLSIRQSRKESLVQCLHTALEIIGRDKIAEVCEEWNQGRQVVFTHDQALQPTEGYSVCRIPAPPPTTPAPAKGSSLEDNLFVFDA